MLFSAAPAFETGAPATHSTSTSLLVLLLLRWRRYINNKMHHSSNCLTRAVHTHSAVPWSLRISKYLGPVTSKSAKDLQTTPSTTRTKRDADQLFFRPYLPAEGAAGPASSTSRGGAGSEVRAADGKGSASGGDAGLGFDAARVDP